MESEKHKKDALQEGLVNKFKLSKTVTTTNLVAFDPEGGITKYENPEDIFKSFYYVRLKYYQMRKDYVFADLNKELVVFGKKRSIIIAELKAKNFDTFSKKKEAEQAGEEQPFAENEEEEGVTEEEGSEESVGDGYNYLLGMTIWSITKENVDKLFVDVA
ncbi:DNA topoisomerase 2 [Rhizina undulata]